MNNKPITELNIPFERIAYTGSNEMFTPFRRNLQMNVWNLRIKRMMNGQRVY